MSGIKKWMELFLQVLSLLSTEEGHRSGNLKQKYQSDIQTFSETSRKIPIMKILFHLAMSCD